MRALTTKQAELLAHVVKQNPDGSFLDLDQLLDKCSWKPSKDTLHFSIRFMIQKGMIEKKGLEHRRGAQRRVIAPTMAGYAEHRELRRVASLPTSP